MTREEAIRILASSCIPGSKQTEALETLIPELAESEDERIRKRLIEYFEGFRIGNAKVKWEGLTVQDVLDWLEKQKEQKPLHWRRIEDATTQRTDDGCCVTSEKMLVKGWINDEDYRIVDENTMVNRDMLCIPVRELNAEQKEQKHILKFKVGDKVHLEGDDVNILTITGIEKDRYLTDCAYGPILFGAEDIWERIDQKPAEWSKEDEHRRKDAIYFLESAKRHYADTSEIEKTINYLKSLKPYWKPSEEQMDRLFSIVAALRKDYCDDMADFLANLYADLKKLGVKEEPEYYQHFDPDC